MSEHGSTSCWRGSMPLCRSDCATPPSAGPRPTSSTSLTWSVPATPSTSGSTASHWYVAHNSQHVFTLSSYVVEGSACKPGSCSGSLSVNRAHNKECFVMMIHLREWIRSTFCLLHKGREFENKYVQVKWYGKIKYMCFTYICLRVCI